MQKSTVRNRLVNGRVQCNFAMMLRREEGAVEKRAVWLIQQKANRSRTQIAILDGHASL